MNVFRSLLVIATTLFLTTCVDMAEIAESKPVNLTGLQTEQIRATVIADFFDPDAAQFRNIRAADLTLSDGKHVRRVCGEVNGKNRLGGYVGYELFGGTMENGVFIQQDFFMPCEPW